MIEPGGKFHLTTAIAYVNGAPHMGHVLEFIQADAVARHHRAKGDDVFFLTGTDEHGAKIARAAEAAGMTPRAYADMNAEKFRLLKETLDLSWDDFIRTSDEARHFPNAVDIWNRIAAAGDLYKKTYEGLYCVGHEAFVTEKDLLAPSGVEGEIGICRDHGVPPEKISEENYFFRLSKYADKVADIIRSGELTIIPEGRGKEILNFIAQGMEDVSFSRPSKDISWGIPVPNDPEHTMYVWCDALANYLHPRDKWPADLHMIGKDILRFHALYWPAMLLSANLPLPKTLFVHGHITSGGAKMSKTLGNVVDPLELVAKYGVDALRYYLLREIPPTEDGDFGMERFKARYEADLASGLGNFAARVKSLAGKYGIEEVSVPETAVLGAVKAAGEAVDAKMADYRFHDAVAAVWELISFGDRYMSEKKPWEKAMEEGSRATAIGNAMYLLSRIADLLMPFLPHAAGEIKKGNAGALFPRIP